MTAMAPDFDHTAGIRDARRAVAESKAGRKSTDRIVAQSAAMFAAIAKAHNGPDFFVERLREAIRGK